MWPKLICMLLHEDTWKRFSRIRQLPEDANRLPRQATVPNLIQRDATRRHRHCLHHDHGNESQARRSMPGGWPSSKWVASTGHDKLPGHSTSKNAHRAHQKHMELVGVVQLVIKSTVLYQSTKACTCKRKSVTRPHGNRAEHTRARTCPLKANVENFSLNKPFSSMCPMLI
jgi:hypothetical protein